MLPSESGRHILRLGSCRGGVVPVSRSRCYGKFSPSDVRERRHWDEYQQAFDIMLSQTSTSLGALTSASVATWLRSRWASQLGDAERTRT
jgi:hypothetical protein